MAPLSGSTIRSAVLGPDVRSGPFVCAPTGRAEKCKTWRTTNSPAVRHLLGVERVDQGTIEVANATAELTEVGKLVSVAGGATRCGP